MNITKQEEYWIGGHGDDYTLRNDNIDQVSLNTAWLLKALSCIRPISSALEIGANVGYCLSALKNIMPNIKLTGIEINQTACRELEKIKGVDALCKSVSEIEPTSNIMSDLVFTRALLIHIANEQLESTYNKIFSLSKRYILICEYYNPSPTYINYRGSTDILQKRDFAGELLDKYPLELLDYGFLYHRDPLFPQDDLNWFLMEKK